MRILVAKLCPTLSAMSVFLLTPTIALSAQWPDLDGVGFDRGDPDAPLVVVEFADFGCSACTQFALETLPVIEEQLISTGRVRWKLIPFELGAFKRSKEATIAAICAAEQESFWPIHDALFANGGEWKRSHEPQQVFRELIADVGLDTVAFDQCYGSDDAENRAKSLRKLAREAGVRGTPTFFVGGRKLEGAPSTEEFLELLTESR